MREGRDALIPDTVDGVVETMSTEMLTHLLNPPLSADGGEIVSRLDSLMAIRLQALSRDIKESMELALRTELRRCMSRDLDAHSSSADSHPAGQLTPLVSSPETEGFALSVKDNVTAEAEVPLKRTRASMGQGSALSPTDISQFERLKDSETGVLKIAALVSLVSSYNPGEELENVTKAVDFAVGDPSMLTQQESHIGIDYDGFISLKSGNILAEAAHGIKRDLKLLQDALHNEQLHFMYRDHGQGSWHAKDEEKYQVAGMKGHLLTVIPSMIVVLQAVVFGLSADNVPDSVVWEIIEVAFATFYFLEAAYKIYLITVFGYFCGPERGWNLLDFGCLLLSLIDATIVHILQLGQDDLQNFALLRMLRLGKLARLVKTLRLKVFHELQLMLIGLISGIRVLMWAVIMLVSFIYIIALVLNKLLQNEEEFQSLTTTMSTLFRCFTDGCNDYNGAPLTERLRKTYGAPAFALYALLYILVAVGVFNLFTALFIDNVFTTQAARKQRDLSDSRDSIEVLLQEAMLKLVMQSSRASGLTDEVQEEIDSLDAVFSKREFRIRKQFQCLCDAGIIINCQQFGVWLEDSYFTEVLELADVDIHNKEALFEVLDADLGGSLTVREVFHGIMRLRGPVTKYDIVAIRLKAQYLTTTISELCRTSQALAIMNDGHPANP